MNLTKPAALLLLVVISLTGCGSGERVPRIPISGTVTLDGEAIPLAEISFVSLPDDVSSIRPQSMGQVKDGKFEIRKEQGPVAGQQLARIVVLKEVATEPDPSSEAPQPKTRFEEVGRYSVTVEIPENASTQFEIKATSKDVAPVSSGV